MSISAHFKSLPNLSRAAEELTRKKEFRSQDANASNSEQVSMKLHRRPCVSALSSHDCTLHADGLLSVVVEDFDNLLSGQIQRSDAGLLTLLHK